MNRITRTVSRITALLLAIGLGAPAFATDCLGVTFSFQNNAPETIKLQKIRYYDATSATWHNAGPVVTICAVGATCVTPARNLVGALGHDITEIRYYHRHWTGGGWGAAHYLAYSTSIPACSDFRYYGTAIVM